MWALVYLETTIPFPKDDDENVVYEGIEIKIFRLADGKLPYAGVNLRAQSRAIAVEEAHRLLADYFTAVAWATNSTARFHYFAVGNVPYRAGRPVQPNFIGRRFHGDFVPVGISPPAKLALALFRQGRATPDPHLSYLYFYNVIQRITGRRRQAQFDLLNELAEAVSEELPKAATLHLAQQGGCLGAYLLEKRNAVAHAISDTGFIADPNDPVELRNMDEHSRYMQALARAAILVCHGVFTDHELFGETGHRLAGLQALIGDPLWFMMEAKLNIARALPYQPHKVSARIRFAAQLPAFEHMVVRSFHYSHGTIELRLLSRYQGLTFSMGINPRAKDWEFDPLAHIKITDDGSFNAAVAFRDYWELMTALFANGQLELYDCERDSLLFRSTEYLPENIDLQGTFREWGRRRETAVAEMSRRILKCC